MDSRQKESNNNGKSHADLFIPGQSYVKQLSFDQNTLTQYCQNFILLYLIGLIGFSKLDKDYTIIRNKNICFYLTVFTWITLELKKR